MRHAQPGTDDGAAGMPGTAARILDTAERLFADQGYNGVSMRRLTDEAGVNLAAVRYHFGSKEDLLHAVYARRAGGLNAERHRLMDACERAMEAGATDVAALLEAYIGPMLRLSRASEGGRRFIKLVSIDSVDPTPAVRRIGKALYDEVGQRWAGLLARACPDLTADDVFWRMTAAYGAMFYASADNGRVARVVPGAPSAADPRNAVEHLIPFLAAGFRSPRTGKTGPKRPQGRETDDEGQPGTRP